jgi:ankyrin repeat protein
MEAVDQAFWPGYAPVIYLLLEAGANPNVQDIRGDAPLLQLLYADPPEPLEENRLRAFALSLHSQFNPDVDLQAPGIQGTPLNLAIRRNDTWAVGMILEKNASLELRDSASLTPLQLASSLGVTNVTESSLNP